MPRTGVMITVITRMIVRPEKRKEFVQTILGMVDPSRQRDRCVSRDFYQDTRNEDRFVLLEQWEKRTDLDEHFRSDWFHILLGTRNLLREAPHITVGVLAHPSLMS